MHGKELERKTATTDVQSGPDCPCSKAQLHCAPIDGCSEHIVGRSGCDGRLGNGDDESSCDDRIVVHDNVGVCNGRGGDATFASQYSDNDSSTIACRTDRPAWVSRWCQRQRDAQAAKGCTQKGGAAATKGLGRARTGYAPWESCSNDTSTGKSETCFQSRI